MDGPGRHMMYRHMMRSLRIMHTLNMHPLPAGAQPGNAEGLSASPPGRHAAAEVRTGAQPGGGGHQPGDGRLRGRRRRRAAQGQPLRNFNFHIAHGPVVALELAKATAGCMPRPHPGVVHCTTVRGLGGSAARPHACALHMQACATAGLDLWTSGRRVLPALGLAWTNCVNQRLFLARTQRGDGGGGVLRQACVVFSPYLPQVGPGHNLSAHSYSYADTLGHAGFRGLCIIECLLHLRAYVRCC